jgi:methylated-DNA-[protein]-cysteine S-methyltransferase
MTRAAHFTLFPTPVGACAIAWRNGKICASHLPEADDGLTEARIAKRAGGAGRGDPPTFVRSAIEGILDLLSGSPNDLAFIDCDFTGLSPLQTGVYRLARQIMPGKTRTYGELALELGGKALAQAVGKALGDNPLPIIVPCHRILGAGGRLTGFSAGGGVNTKLKLLEIEKAQVGIAPTLFGELPLALKRVDRAP